MIKILSEKQANKKLIEELPFLDDNNLHNTKLDDECPEGWTKLKLDFYRELKPLLIKYNCIDEYEIVQSKEKWGSWRLYAVGIPSEMENEYFELLHKYKKISEHTCIHCGKEAKMCDFGWIIFPICKECWDKGYISDTRNYDEIVIKENNNAN